MVYGEIIRQGQLFLLAAALGAGLLLCYDFLRIFRRLVRHKTWGIAAEDLLFWLCCALVMFGFMYRMNEGVIRGFLVLGTAVGMVLYSIFLSPHLIRCGTAVCGKIAGVLGRLLRLAGRPLCRAGRMAGAQVCRAGRICKKRTGKWKKQLKKIGKAVRIGLSKL